MVNSAIANALVDVDGEGEEAQRALFPCYYLLYDVICKELRLRRGITGGRRGVPNIPCVRRLLY